MSEYAPRLWDKLRTTPLSDVLRGQLSASLDWRARIARHDLPKSVVVVVGEVVRRTGLWRTEKIAVAEELAGHFRDGLDAGSTIEGLVESFGDARTAAKLIRRAKRRCRPLWWQAWWYASRTFAGLCALYVAAAVWLAFERPVVSVNYLDVLNREARAVPAEDRAWPLYFEALKMIVKEQQAERGGVNPIALGEFSSQGNFRDWLPKRSEETTWTPKQAARAEEWVDSHRLLIEKLMKAAAKPGFGADAGAGSSGLRDFVEIEPLYVRAATADPKDVWLFSTPLPQTQELGNVAKAMVVVARAAFERDDAEESVDAIRAILGVSRHAGEVPILICALVQLRIRNMAVDEVHRVLAEKPALWSDDHLRDLAHGFAQPERPLAFYFDGERATVLDAIQRVYSPRGVLTHAGLRELASWDREDWLVRVGADTAGVEPTLWALAPAVTLSSPTAGESHDALSRLFDMAIEEAGKPLATSGETAKLAQTLSRENAVVGELCGFLTGGAHFLERFAGDRDGVLLGIALELYRRDAGEWPAALDELAPRYMPQLPFDRINGGPLGYRVAAGRPVVYSLGRDADDDGGKLCALLRPEAEDRYGAQRTAVDLDRPYSAEELRTLPSSQTDGDWVIWSLGAPRYVEVEE
jgi:hypothetical protein